METFDLANYLTNSVASREAAKRRAASEKIGEHVPPFLIDREGNIVARFEPTEDMKTVALRVMDLLS